MSNKIKMSKFGFLTTTIFALALVSLLAPRAAEAVTFSSLSAVKGYSSQHIIGFNFDDTLFGNRIFRLYARYDGSPLTACSDDYYTGQYATWNQLTGNGQFSSATWYFDDGPERPSGGKVSFAIGAVSPAGGLAACGTNLEDDLVPGQNSLFGYKAPPQAPTDAGFTINSNYIPGTFQIRWFSSPSGTWNLWPLKYRLQGREWTAEGNNVWSDLRDINKEGNAVMEHLFTPAIAGQIYEFRVFAASGFGVSWPGGQLWWSPSTVTKIGYQPPLPPSNVAASDGTFNDRVRITWSAPVGNTRISGYRITRTDSSGNARQYLVTAGTTTYDDSDNVVTGTVYQYAVETQANTGALPGLNPYSTPIGNTGYRGATAIMPAVLNPADVQCNATTGLPTGVKLTWSGDSSNLDVGILAGQYVIPLPPFWNKHIDNGTELLAGVGDQATGGANTISPLVLANGQLYTAWVSNGVSSNLVQFTPNCALPDTPGFSLTANPARLVAVKGGGPVSTTITVTRNNSNTSGLVSFSGTGLGISGLPATGVSASFSPTFCSLGNSSPSCTVTLSITATEAALTTSITPVVTGKLATGPQPTAQFSLPLEIVNRIVSESCGALDDYTWAGPTAVAPGGNKPAPINVGGNSQIKTGCLGLGAVGTPTARLDVIGNIRASGNVTATALTETSDARLKENLKSLGESLAKVLQLQGVSYQLKADPARRVQLGLVAQEVEKVFPEVVFTDAAGFKSLDYSRLLAPVIEAIKTQQTQLEALAKQVADLRAAVSR